MATLKFMVLGKSETVSIYVRYSFSREKTLQRKTGFQIKLKDWSTVKAQPILRDENLKDLKFRLDKLSLHIEDSCNKAINSGIEISNDWLQEQIDVFNKRKQIVDLDILTNYIQKYIDEAPFKQNQNKEIGLSNGRIQNIKLFKSTILRYELGAFKGKSILIKNIDLKFVENFKMWLLNQDYSVNYVGKNIANIRTMCLDAAKNDIETSTQVKNIKGLSEQKPPEQIIYLNESEQKLIKEATLTREALINARKWLLLGCLIGQRGGDLLSITEGNIKEIKGKKIIELRQQKTNKIVAIPLLPNALEIIEDGMPYKIALTKFNEYIKEVCKSAGLIVPTHGRKKLKSKSPTVKGIYPKHELISSHICRRSFATNFYARIPTPILMNITAHGTEKMFLTYIGKTSYDNAEQMLEYFAKL